VHRITPRYEYCVLPNQSSHEFGGITNWVYATLVYATKSSVQVLKLAYLYVPKEVYTNQNTTPQVELTIF
jgi:hypothetical protein